MPEPSPALSELQAQLRQQFLAVTDVVSLAAALTLADTARKARQPKREDKPVPNDVETGRPVRVASINYCAYHKKDRYHTFTIPKKSGEPRQIKSPAPGLKWIQRLLNECFQTVFTPREAATGFIVGRSVVTNASRHIGRRFVFNLDIKDFFPSTHFGRVHAVLQLEPFSFSPEVAYLIANLCTDVVADEQAPSDGETDKRRAALPQGAPTSPFLTNLVCRRLDTKLVRLAQANRCTYSRYADDITFSANREVFTEALREQVRQIIRTEGYTPHPTKERIQTTRDRQEVTGVVVNRRPNVTRHYYREVKVMLHHWEVWGYERAAAFFHKQYNREGKGSSRKRFFAAPSRERSPTFKRALLGKIEYLGMVRGKDDARYLNLRQRYDDVSGRTAREVEAELTLLKQLSE